MNAAALSGVKRVPLWFARVLPYTGAASVVILSSGLIATIFFTTLDLHWLVFLAGVLTAASLSLASRASSRAWSLARRTSQLASARSNLTKEGVLRKRAEAALSGLTQAAHYADELPAMVCYIDPERRIQYHNRAYAQWLGKGSTRLEGRALAELHGAMTWREMGPELDQAFAGATVRNERVQTMLDGQKCRLATLYLPHFGEGGKVLGAFCVLADITRPEDGRASGIPAVDIDAGKERALYSSTMAGELTTWDDVGGRLKDALEGDQFSLHAQRIEPALASAHAPLFLEVLLRLQEEEDNMVPPGAFLPLAEERGLLPQIDRWVVRRLRDFAAGSSGVEGLLFSVNVSTASIADPAFVPFVRDCWSAFRGRGPGLCFEFNEAEAMANIERTTEFVRELANVGCRFALAGFGRDPVDFALQRRIAFDYVKIDAGVVLGVARSPVELAKVKAITRVVHSLGSKTIAQCVESSAVRSLLADAGVDLVQGFAVARPAPLAGLLEPAAR